MQARLRLRHSSDFARVRAQGRSWRHPLVILSAVAQGVGEHAPDHNRYGVIVTRRIGNAVKRNRARRLLREALRRQHPWVRSGYDVVLIARAGIVGKTLADVEQAVCALLRQAHLLVPCDERDSEGQT